LFIIFLPRVEIDDESFPAREELAEEESPAPPS
jgi:hypothetical protein